MMNRSVIFICVNWGSIKRSYNYNILLRHCKVVKINFYILYKDIFVDVFCSKHKLGGGEDIKKTHM